MAAKFLGGVKIHIYCIFMTKYFESGGCNLLDPPKSMYALRVVEFFFHKVAPSTNRELAPRIGRISIFSKEDIKI